MADASDSKSDEEFLRKGSIPFSGILISTPRSTQLNCEVPCMGGIRALDSKFKICSNPAAQDKYLRKQINLFFYK